MPAEPYWLSAEIVIEINEAEVAATGEPFIVLDRGKLDGALGRPPTRYHYQRQTDVVILASHLLFAVAQSHAFQQGNKRTGFTAAGVFLELNGFSLQAPDTKQLADLIVEVIEYRADFMDFVDAIRPFVEPHDPD